MMNMMQIEILNPKAAKLLNDLADLKLISICNTQNDGFIKLINKVRTKAKSNPVSYEDITNEVEEVRTKRYEKSKR